MYIAIVKNYGCKKLNVWKRLPLVPWCPGALVPWPLPMHVQHRVAHVIQGQALLTVEVVGLRLHERVQAGRVDDNGHLRRHR